MLFKIGIDLGYANTTLIGTATADIIRQPSVITVDNVTHRMVSLGDEAMEIAMNTEDGEALLLRPFRYGMLHSSDNTQDIIRAILKRVRRPADTKIRAIIGVPANFTAGQERHLFSIMQDCDIAEHFLSSVAEARSLYCYAYECAAQLVEHERRKSLALDVLGDDEQLLARLNDLLEQRHQILNI